MRDYIAVKPNDIITIVVDEISPLMCHKREPSACVITADVSVSGRDLRVDATFRTRDFGDGVHNMCMEYSLRLLMMDAGRIQTK